MWNLSRLDEHVWHDGPWVLLYPYISHDVCCHEGDPGVGVPRLASRSLTAVSAWRVICSTVCHARYSVPMLRDRGGDPGGMLHPACPAVRDDFGRDTRCLRGGRWLPGGRPSCGDGQEWTCKTSKPWTEAAMRVDREHMEEACRVVRASLSCLLAGTPGLRRHGSPLRMTSDERRA